MPPFSFETTADDVVRVLSNEIREKNAAWTVGFSGSKDVTLEETKAEILKDAPEANLKLLLFDLGSQDSIRKAAAEVSSYKENFDVLLNVAGVMATPYAKTADGIESQFGINHIGPFLFTNLILPKLNKNARIINISSRGYQLGSILWEDIGFEKESYNKWHAYAQSKAANILFSSALARRLASKEIRSYSVHPGSIKTNIQRNMTQEDSDMMSGIPMKYKTVQQGAANMIMAAFDPSINDRNGGHYDDDNQIKPIPEAYAYAIGVDNEDRLWELSERLIGQKFTY